MRHAGVNLDKPPAGEGRPPAVLHRLKAQSLAPMMACLASPAAHSNRDRSASAAPQRWRILR
ncbi:MAG: hypothetical protein C0476_02505 [Sphingomonas sp.]|nr:hypothetical protein [Sphingomonas sp.]